MKDQYGREINYIRVSVTDRCNLRCVYCMPAEGVEQVPHQDILSYDEIARLIRIGAGKGITRVKLTGGEPLVRKGLAELVGKLKSTAGIEEVTLTTNGVLLKEQMAELAKAGIGAVNISLDTLDKEMYASIARRDQLEAALAGIEEALQYPEVRVKINCVPLKGVNENQWSAIAGLAKDEKIDVRFIEMMPIGLGKEYEGRHQEEILKTLRASYGKERILEGRFGNGPSVYVQFEGFTGKIGFISAITHKFCGDCNRVRLTAEGFLKPCLQYAAGTDLRALLRGDASDEELAAVMEDTIYRKPRSHHFETGESPEFEQNRMSRIGG